MGMPPTGMAVGPFYQPMGEAANYGNSGHPGFATDSSERTRTAVNVAQTVGLTLLLAAGGSVRSSKSSRRNKVMGIPYR